ncbi:hypothetical protein ACIQMP_07570 [Streptomyces sp. NPDC091385]|uniref:hypothetical protein n=1 Tax=Streptomyces sp. NPDC091385 TaxID=3365997 RepID=UPI0037F4B007
MSGPIHPATARMLANFDFDHLPEHLQPVAEVFHTVAHGLAELLSGPEVTKALDSLFEAQNWAVVAAIREDADGTSPDGEG